MPAAERRHLTVMFVDIAGSTALSERLDPEEFFAILNAYHDLCGEQVRRYGGHVARIFGDGLLAYFGLPRAHEDDAERAVHAALSIIAALAQRDFTVPGSGPVRLIVRIAVNTGMVVAGPLAGEAAGERVEVFGTAAHVAARLQEVAPPNGAVVGPATYELVRRAFRWEYLGERELKGIASAVKCWRVLGGAPSESRFERTRQPSLTPLIGREAELAQLTALWRRSAAGHGQVVVISGEPGIGKSRLVHGFRASLAAQPKEALYFHCSPFHVNTPIYPVIEQVRRAAGLRGTESPARAVEKLRAFLAIATALIDEMLPYYGALLSIPPVPGYRPADLGSPRERERMLDAMIEVTLALSRRVPVIEIVEDAQWIDPTSAELIARLVPRLASARILLCITHRGNLPPDWLAGAQVSALPLGRLAAPDCERMVASITGNALMPRILVERIIERTDGIPLFLEEFTHSVLDSGALCRRDGRLELSGPVPDPLVPATLQDLLVERLDRLGETKRVAQIASVLGRWFIFDDLAHLSGLASGNLMELLDRLEATALLRRHGEPPSATFAFKHAMIQEAAYASLLKEDRRELHARAVEWLRAGAAPDDSSRLALLAHHCSRAGLAEAAVGHWLEAGKVALHRSANKEAIAHLRDGLQMLARLPASDRAIRTEIELQSNLAMAYTAHEGWAGLHVDRAYARALELCRSHGTLRQKSILLWGVTITKTVSIDLQCAFRHVEEFLALAEESHDEEVVLMAHTASVIGNFFLGRLESARKSADFVCRLYDQARHGKLVDVYQHDPKVVALVYSGHIEWILGRPRRARACCEEARRLARSLGHPFMLALALILGASDHLYEHKVAANLASIEEGIEIAQKHGLQMYEIFGPLWAVEAVVARDPRPQTLDRLAKLVDRLLQYNCGLNAPLYQVFLAAEYARFGWLDRARELAEAAERIMTRTGECWFAPEVYRVHAELVAQGPQADVTKAQALYERALAAAREMGALGWELRTALSFARFLAAHGRGGEGRPLLDEVRAKFVEGETSVDLRAAAALTAALGVSP